MVRVCLAGATGWAGSELARAIGGDLELVSAVSRSHAGKKLGGELQVHRIDRVPSRRAVSFHIFALAQ
jgi:4-hydroxy-tetrahydrodipicolinate reductase